MERIVFCIKAIPSYQYNAISSMLAEIGGYYGLLIGFSLLDLVGLLNMAWRLLTHRDI